MVVQQKSWGVAFVHNFHLIIGRQKQVTYLHCNDCGTTIKIVEQPSHNAMQNVGDSSLSLKGTI